MEYRHSGCNPPSIPRRVEPGEEKVSCYGCERGVSVSNIPHCSLPCTFCRSVSCSHSPQPVTVLPSQPTPLPHPCALPAPPVATPPASAALNAISTYTAAAPSPPKPLTIQHKPTSSSLSLSSLFHKGIRLLFSIVMFTAPWWASAAESTTAPGAISGPMLAVWVLLWGRRICRQAGWGRNRRRRRRATSDRSRN